MRVRESGITVVLCVIAVTVGALLSAGRDATAVALVVAVLAPTAIWAGPKWPSSILFFFLGAVPYAAVSLLGRNVPIFVLLAVWWWLSTLSRPKLGQVENGPRQVNYLMAVLWVGASSSFILTVQGAADITEWLKWTAAMAIFPLLSRSRDTTVLLRRFSHGIAVGSLASLALLLLPELLRLLSLLGYVRSTGDQAAYLLYGESVASRLGGTYIDPNIAGLFCFVGLFLTVALDRGSLRVFKIAIICLALVCTLSRGAWLGVGIAVVVLIAVSSVALGRKVALALIVGATGTVALSNPVVASRLESTLSREDIGSRDRLAAIQQFAATMEGNWLSGLGWGRDEFRDSAISFSTNMVANAPLAAIYRGGLLAGIPFAALLVVTGALAFRNLRARSQDFAIPALVIGLMCTIQTGYSVVIAAQAAALLAVVMAALVKPIEQPLSDSERAALVHHEVS